MGGSLARAKTLGERAFRIDLVVRECRARELIMWPAMPNAPRYGEPRVHEGNADSVSSAITGTVDIGGAGQNGGGEIWRQVN